MGFHTKQPLNSNFKGKLGTLALWGAFATIHGVRNHELWVIILDGCHLFHSNQTTCHI